MCRFCSVERRMTNVQILSAIKQIFNISGGINMRELKRFLAEEDGMGVVEVILIIVVLISLVALFKTQISQLVTDVLKKVSGNAKKI